MDTMVITRMEIRGRIADKKELLVELTAAESTWGELANAVSARIKAEKRELTILEARL